MRLFVLFVLLISFSVVASAESMPLSKQYMLSSVPSDPECVQALQYANKAVHDNNMSDVSMVALSFVDEGFCQVYNIIEMRDPDNIFLSPHEVLESIFQMWKEKKYLYSYEQKQDGLVWILKEHPPTNDKI